MRNRFPATLAGVFFLWLLVAKLVALPIVPSPVAVAENIGGIFMKDIAVHCLYSLLRIVLGLLAAIVVGVPMGILMGAFPRADRLLSPLVYLSYPVPKIALLPIVMLVFGVGELSKAGLLFLILVFQIVLAVRDGIRSSPEEAYYPLRSLGASFWVMLREVMLPASMPGFLTAVRVAMGTAISVLFFTETFGTQYGMGYFIMDAWLRVNYLEMYSGIVVLSLTGLLIFGALDLAGRRLCRWQWRGRG